MGIDGRALLAENHCGGTPADDSLLLRLNFAIDCVRVSASAIVVVSGEVDLCTAPRLEERLRDCHEAGVSVMLDLEQVEFMDAAGLRVLLDADERSAPGDFSVTPGSPQVQRLFELTGAEAVLHVVPLAHEAAQGAA